MRTSGIDGCFLYGDASPADVYLLADVHAVDAGIVRWLASRRRRWKLARVAPLIARHSGAGGDSGAVGMAAGPHRDGI
jgi:hypothetical protein